MESLGYIFQSENPLELPVCSACVAAMRKPIQASLFCQDCCRAFCDECVIEAHRAKTHHRIEQVRTKNAKEAIKELIFCLEHKNERRDQFCFSCDKAICIKCGPKYHMDHNIKLADTAISRIGGDLEKLKKQFNQENKEFIENIVTKPLKSAFAQINELLKAKENELISGYSKTIRETLNQNTLLAYLTKEESDQVGKPPEEIDSKCERLIFEQEICAWRKKIRGLNHCGRSLKALADISDSIVKHQMGGAIIDVSFLQANLETKLTISPDLKITRLEGLNGWRSAVLRSDIRMSPRSGVYSWECRLIEPPRDSFGLGFISGVISEYKNFDLIDQKPYSNSWYISAKGNKGSCIDGDQCFIEALPDKEFVIGFKLDYRNQEGVLTVAIDNQEQGELHGNVRGTVLPFFAVSNANGSFVIYPFVNLRKMVI
jgi:hypothetical protein